MRFQTNRENLRFRFNISGISGATKQEGDLEQLMFIIKTLMSTPLAPRINWTKVGEEMLRRKGFDPKAFLIAAQVQPPEVGVGGTPTEIAGAEAVANVMPPQGIVSQ